MSVAKRKWQETTNSEQFTLGMWVTVNVSSVVIHTTERYEYNFKSGWMNGKIRSIQNKKISVYFPDWDKTYTCDISLVKSLGDFTTENECNAGDIVHVNNSILPHQSMNNLWWEACVIDRCDDSVLVEWLEPGRDDAPQYILPCKAIRIFK